VHVSQRRLIIDTEGARQRFLRSPITGRAFTSMSDGMTDPLQAYASCQLCGLSFNRQGINKCRTCLSKLIQILRQFLKVLDKETGCDQELFDVNLK
jgi:hypothetical protein